MMNIKNYNKKLESMNREELLHEISNLISDHGIQLQDKCNELQELKSALARADLQLQFQIGEVDLRDKEIENLKGKRKPEDNEVLNILNNFSEIAYKQGCAKDILKVVDYINWQKAEIERLTEENAIIKGNPPMIVGRSNGKTIRAKLLAFDKMKERNAELQKQIDELKEQRDVFKNLFENCNNSSIKTEEIICAMNSFYREQAQHLVELKIEQVVKDTAKEIFDKCVCIDKATGNRGLICIEAIMELVKSKGVEVE